MDQSYLKSRLDYCPETGELTWRKVHQKSLVGQPAGYVSDDGYLKIKLDGKLYSAHNLAWFWMNGEWPVDLVDHENGVRTDNRWENLRAATHTQNMMNRGNHCNNTSGYPGVDQVDSGSWRSRIMAAGRRISLGIFKTFEEAVEVRKRAEKRYRGQFSRPL